MKEAVMFKSLMLKNVDAVFNASLADISESALPTAGEVLVRIEYSSLNYKDALAITNTAPIVRHWPMVAGIDGAGVVEASSHVGWHAGDKFIMTGYGVGESHWGCLAEKARLKGDWLVPLPDGMTTRQAMTIGTAGFTAMLSVLALEQHGITPQRGPVLVTGAAGGVGSMAIALLASVGYSVVASTGRLSESAYLQSLGAGEVIDRATLSVPQPNKPLQRERWAGVIDCVGSHTLVNACAQCQYDGLVAACGLAQGMDFPASVAPFILRGVTMAGINSVLTPQPLRREAWGRLAQTLNDATLNLMMNEITLKDAISTAQRLRNGEVRGRVVVKIDS